MANIIMIIKKTKFFGIGLILIVTSLVGFGQSRQEKTETIIKKLNLIENQKTNYLFRLEPLKYQAVGSDSLRIIEVENLASRDLPPSTRGDYLMKDL